MSSKATTWSICTAVLSPLTVFLFFTTLFREVDGLARYRLRSVPDCTL